MCWLCGSRPKVLAPQYAQQKSKHQPSPPAALPAPPNKTFPSSGVLVKIPTAPSAKLAPARQVTNPKASPPASQEPSPSQPNKPKTKESDGSTTAKLAPATGQVATPPAASQGPYPSSPHNMAKTKESDGGSLSNPPPLPAHLQLQPQPSTPSHDHHPPMHINPQELQQDQAASASSTNPLPSISQQPKQQHDLLPNNGKRLPSESSCDHFPSKSYNCSPSQYSEFTHDQQPPPSPPPRPPQQASSSLAW